MPGGEMWGAYPESKAEAERELLALEAAWTYAIGRLPFVYGEGDPHLADVHAVGRALGRRQRLQMAHHADVAQGLRRLLYAPGSRRPDLQHRRRRPCHAGRAVPAQRRRGARRLCTSCTDPDPWFGIMSTDRIRRELGFRPVYPSASGRPGTPEPCDGPGRPPG